MLYSALLCSKEPALQHQFSEAIDKLNRVREAEISSETCIKWPNQTKPSIFGTSWRISQPHDLGLTYRLLHWNGVAKPVLLNIINPLFDNIFFRPKGRVRCFLAAQDHHFHYFLKFFVFCNHLEKFKVTRKVKTHIAN